MQLSSWPRTHQPLWLLFFSGLCQISSVFSTKAVRGAFHLDPVGVESGTWSEWEPESPCSRSCGVGILSETRRCLSEDCMGSTRRYFTCNPQPCPSEAADFRAEQCSQFDSVPYQGRHYKWTPYKKGLNKCELLCRPENGSFYVSFAAQVTDGTPCNEEGTSVCVKGKCVSIGCDKMLGSHLQEDKCAVCGGDGSQCKLVEGLYDESDIPESTYAEFLIIPAGSTNIQVRERRPSENYLSMRTISGEYILNGDFKVETSNKRIVNVAGTSFVYHRKSSINPPAELLISKGPTTEPIIIAMLHQEANPGVLYEFYAPKSFDNTSPLTYTWLARAYSQCSTGCGGGSQTREVVCVRTNDYEPVSTDLCDGNIKPREERACNPEPCPAFWNAGEWEACSASCGGGIQIRPLICVQKVGERVFVVSNDNCKSNKNKPETSRPCNQEKCPEWTTSDWSQCSAKCGPGFQKRAVVCKSRNARDLGKALPESACHKDKKPAKSQPCMLAACEGLEWAVSDWTGCASCGQTRRTRKAVCTSEDGQVFPDHMCDGAKQPITEEPCKHNPVCDAVWYATEWSKCSANCGNGKRTRQVFCGTFDHGNHHGVTRLPHELCDVEKKPEVEEECNESLHCHAEWFAGPWMACNAPCGGGSRRRAVLCLKNNERRPDAECDIDDKPTDNEECNTEPCDKEGFVPIDSCTASKFGCCPDGITAAEGFNAKGCPLSDAPIPCADTEFGCCSNNVTIANGPYGAGCDQVSGEVPRAPKIRQAPEDEATTAAEGEGETTTVAADAVEADTTTTAPAAEGAEDATTVATDGETTVAADVVEGETTTAATVAEEAGEATTVAADAVEGETTTASAVSEDGSTTAADGETTTVAASADATGDTTAAAADASDATSTVATEVAAGGESTTTTAIANVAGDESTTGTVAADDATTAADVDSTTAASTEGAETGATDVSVVSVVTDASDLVLNATDLDVEALNATELDADNATSIDLSSLNITDSVNATEGGFLDSIVNALLPASWFTANGAENATTNATIGEEDLLVLNDTLISELENMVNITSDLLNATLDALAGNASDLGLLDLELANATEAANATDLGLLDLELENATIPLENVTEAENVTTSALFDTELLSLAVPVDNETLGEDGLDLGAAPMNMTEEAGVEGEDCLQAQWGCCPDNTTAALGPDNMGCDGMIEGSGEVPCADTPYGCCPDNTTAAKGPNKKGCQKLLRTDPQGVGEGGPMVVGECVQTEFGCCSDMQTAALGPDQLGCPERDCVQSEYGCCPDGLTASKGANYEECPHTKPPKQTCELGHDQGSCRNFTIKWYYDTEYGDCNRFWYGGCGGNDNRFEGESECQAECVSPVGVDACHLPKVRGPCDQNQRMWYYDKYVRDCVPFLYGGCLGNENRFETREQCNERCVETQMASVCDQPQRAGNCEAQVPRWSFNRATGKCDQFMYSGCGGNGNRFASEEQCEQKCGAVATRNAEVCLEEKATGDCNEYFPRYYFDRDTRTCQQFVYTGCNGNNNRFTTQGDCESTCNQWLVRAAPQQTYPAEGAQQPPQDDLSYCSEPADRGDGTGSVQKWHYDPSDAVCKKFSYSGEGGNRNKFDSQSECSDQCSRSQDICTLPKITGPCRGAFAVFYFNIETRQCEEFTYGGCQGNLNRFNAAEECQRNCSHLMAPVQQPEVQPEVPTGEEIVTHQPSSNIYREICSMPVDVGACDQDIPRFYYDITQGKCNPFTYTGCGGNQNHFMSQEQCESFCSSFTVGEGVECVPATCPTTCPFGYEQDQGTCPTCRCADPCRDVQCGSGETCTPVGRPSGEWVGTCTSSLEKAGTCPSLADIPPGTCARMCTADNQCPGLQKCCSNGCGRECMTPMEIQEVPFVTTTTTRAPYRPYIEPRPVAPSREYGPEQAAVIAAGPAEIRAEVGRRVSLPCQATGYPKPRILWHHNNRPIGYGDTKYLQQAEELVIDSASESDTGEYLCVANNGIGPAAEYRVQLIVEAAVTIEQRDMTVSAKKGERAILKCAAKGHPKPMVSWSKGAEPIRSSDKYYVAPDGSLFIENVVDGDESVYVCTASNGVSPVAIKNVVLRVVEEVRASILSRPESVRAGSTLTLECRATGQPQPRVRWTLNGRDITNGADRILAYTNGTLIVKNIQASEAGVYQCQAQGQQSTASDSVRIFVTGAVLPQECNDNPYYANCNLIVQANLCDNEYYRKFCCKSCTEAGQIRRRRRRAVHRM